MIPVTNTYPAIRSGQVPLAQHARHHPEDCSRPRRQPTASDFGARELPENSQHRLAPGDMRRHRCSNVHESFGRTRLLPLWSRASHFSRSFAAGRSLLMPSVARSVAVAAGSVRGHCQPDAPAAVAPSSGLRLPGFLLSEPGSRDVPRVRTPPCPSRTRRWFEPDHP